MSSAYSNLAGIDPNQIIQRNTLRGNLFDAAPLIGAAIADYHRGDNAITQQVMEMQEIRRRQGQQNINNLLNLRQLQFDAALRQQGEAREQELQPLRVKGAEADIASKTGEEKRRSELHPLEVEGAKANIEGTKAETESRKNYGRLYGAKAAEAEMRTKALEQAMKSGDPQQEQWARMVLGDLSASAAKDVDLLEQIAEINPIVDDTLTRIRLGGRDSVSPDALEHALATQQNFKSGHPETRGISQYVLDQMHARKLFSSNLTHRRDIINHLNEIAVPVRDNINTLYLLGLEDMFRADVFGPLAEQFADKEGNPILTPEEIEEIFTQEKATKKAEKLKSPEHKKWVNENVNKINIMGK